MSVSFYILFFKSRSHRGRATRTHNAINVRYRVVDVVGSAPTCRPTIHNLPRAPLTTLNMRREYNLDHNHRVRGGWAYNLDLTGLSKKVHIFRRFGFTKALLCIPIPAMAPLATGVSYWYVFNVVKRWLYGLAEYIIICDLVLRRSLLGTIQASHRPSYTDVRSNSKPADGRRNTLLGNRWASLLTWLLEAPTSQVHC